MPLHQSFLDNLLSTGRGIGESYLSLHTGAVATSANELDPATAVGYERAAMFSFVGAGRNTGFGWEFTADGVLRGRAMPRGDGAASLDHVPDPVSFPWAQSDWGTVRSVGVSNGETAFDDVGTAVDGYAALGTPIALGRGATLEIPASAIRFALTDVAAAMWLSRLFLYRDTEGQRESAGRITQNIRELFVAGQSAATSFLCLHTGTPPTPENEVEWQGYKRIWMNFIMQAFSAVPPAANAVVPTRYNAATRTLTLQTRGRNYGANPGVDADVVSAVVPTDSSFRSFGRLTNPDAADVPVAWGLWTLPSNGQSPATVDLVAGNLFAHGSIAAGAPAPADGSYYYIPQGAQWALTFPAPT